MLVPAGYRLRPAEPDDVDEIADLLARRGDDADAEDLRLVAADPDEGLESTAVVVHEGRVVATATLLAETLWIDEVPVPTGQVELVATDPAHEGRGLVRALMGWAHQRSVERGDLLQVMIGIPSFYRQFGYAYAMPIPLVRRLSTPPVSSPTLEVRPATPADVAAMQVLQDDVQRQADVRLPHSRACWRWLLARSGSQQLVACSAGDVVACGRVSGDDERVLSELAGSPDGIRALAGRAGVTWVQDRPLAAVDAALDLELLEDPDREREWYYARVPDLAALLEHLGDVLRGRLTAAGLGRQRHHVLISTWGSHVRFDLSEEAMSPVQRGGPLQAPVSAGGSGVAPDAVAPLLLGPDGALGLERRVPDVLLGRQREVMAALFPPVRADLLTFYLPV